MSPGLQAILNNVGSTTGGAQGPLVNVASGKLHDDKLVVLAYLLIVTSGAQYQALPSPTVSTAAAKTVALQGLTQDNLVELMIAGLAFRSGFQGTPWGTLLGTAKAALDGQAGLSPFDYKTIINYSLLYWVSGISVP